MIGRSYNRVVLLGLDLSNENNEKIAHVILPVIAKGNCKVDKW